MENYHETHDLEAAAACRFYFSVRLCDRVRVRVSFPIGWKYVHAFRALFELVFYMMGYGRDGGCVVHRIFPRNSFRIVVDIPKLMFHLIYSTFISV